mmetsp:Transcript_38/g.69  ORF Transcript_38/g.69 Transcript_38/m.69 type:complete len:197 (-) Transcript_38:109-699(-)
MNQQSLGYVFGFKGDGVKAGDSFYEIKSAFPELYANYGLLSGPAFSISYCIAGLFMGILVDKVNRKTLVSTACIVWSLSTILSGFTDSFYVLCLMRFVLGMSVSCTDPAAYSILGDYFPKRLRSTSNSIMNTANYIGAGISSLIVLVVAKFGWRFSYQLVGGMGLVFGLLNLFLVREPERGIQTKLEVQAKLREEE